MRVHRPARRIHIRRRGRVLRNSPPPASVRPAIDPNRGRAWHPRELGQGDACSSRPSGKSSTPPARCIHRPQRDTSSAGYRLLVSLASAGASREPASRRSPALAPPTRRLGPTFRCGAFFFVVSALADVPSARLTLPAANPPRHHGRGGSPSRPLPARQRCRDFVRAVISFHFAALDFHAAFSL